MKTTYSSNRLLKYKSLSFTLIHIKETLYMVGKLTSRIFKRKKLKDENKFRMAKSDPEMILPQAEGLTVMHHQYMVVVSSKYFS